MISYGILNGQKPPDFHNIDTLFVYIWILGLTFDSQVTTKAFYSTRLKCTMVETCANLKKKCPSVDHTRSENEYSQSCPATHCKILVQSAEKVPNSAHLMSKWPSSYIFWLVSFQRTCVMPACSMFKITLCTNNLGVYFVFSYFLLLFFVRCGTSAQ